MIVKVLFQTREDFRLAKFLIVTDSWDFVCRGECFYFDGMDVETSEELGEYMHAVNLKFTLEVYDLLERHNNY